MVGNIGVFVCACGPNIGERIHIDLLMEKISEMDDVFLVQQHGLLCSPDGKSFLEEAIREHDLSRIVVAACSPREHLETFMGVCSKAGINPFMLQMVNIREQCAWVTDDVDLATAKAFRMISGAISRSVLHQPLDIIDIACSPDVVVIGGGLTGLRTALSLTSPDRRVTIVEREHQLGGRHAGTAAVTAMVDEVIASSNIEVLTDSEPVDVKGFFGNFIISLGEEEELTAGAVVLATGSADAPAEMLEDYGYGTLPGVITSAEARSMCLSGRLSLGNGDTARRVAIVHCAAREKAGYCSVACCDATLNLARSITEIAEDVEISVFHSQICTSLPSHKDWIAAASEAGCTLTETGISGVTKCEEGLMLVADLPDTATDPFDIVIIHPPLVPPAGFEQLAAMLRVETGTGGFPKPEHDRLSTVSTAIDGVYIAGGIAGPCRITDAVLQADAAAGTILSVLVPGRMVQTEPCTSVITESLCKGCKTCLEVCTYGAISYIPEKRVCYVNQVLCRGCGGCAASCPSGAARARHFTSGQLRRQVVGVLE